MNADEIQRRSLELESRGLRCPDCHEEPCGCLDREAALTLYCSFCGKSQYEVITLIASTQGGANICSRCVVHCVDTLAHERIKKSQAPDAATESRDE